MYKDAVLFIISENCKHMSVERKIEKFCHNHTRKYYNNTTVRCNYIKLMNL